MISMTRFAVYILISFSIAVSSLYAQEKEPQTKVLTLEEKKERIVQFEKEQLKQKVEAINKQLAERTLTLEEANRQKQEAAQLHALNIENRIAILEHQVALESRKPKRSNDDWEYEDGSEEPVVYRGDDGFSVNINDFDIFFNKEIKYDRRTYSDFVLAVGFNNVYQSGRPFEDSPYQFGGSRFFELGYAWRTRVFDKSNWLRFKYGFSFQFNGLKPVDNQFLITQGDTTQLATFPFPLRKSKFRMDNLVIPLHFEFGPSEVEKTDTKIRYKTRKKFKMGIGGYAGISLGARQKLKYTEDGKRKKDKLKEDYNRSGIVYGISAYLGKGDLSLYAKYELSPIFTGATPDQYLVSAGLRLDL